MLGRAARTAPFKKRLAPLGTKNGSCRSLVQHCSAVRVSRFGIRQVGRQNLPLPLQTWPS